MFCKNCGTQLKEGAKFCGNCGTAVAAAGQLAAPVTPAAPPWQSQQYASAPPAGKKLSPFLIFLIVIPVQYICCSTLFMFYAGNDNLSWWNMPDPQIILFQIALFLVIYGPSLALLFFILKHCVKWRKIAAFVFSIPLALGYIALIVMSLIPNLGFYHGRSNIFWCLYYSYDDSLLVSAIITFYPFIPPLLTLIRFEGSHSQSTSAKMPPPITG
jgi:hypothetical protein